MKNKDKSSEKLEKRNQRTISLIIVYKLSWPKSNKELKNLYNENFKELKKG